MCLVFHLIVFLSIILFESIVGNIVTVGNYSDLNPDGCGLSRHSMGVDTNCMKWDKEIHSPIRGAKRVGLGDAPWTALLLFSKWVGGSEHNHKCTGSVFGDEWILTAGHCMADDNRAYNIRIYFGYDFTHNNPSAEHKYEANGVFVHLKYDPNTTVPSPYDIALVRLNKPIDIIGKQFVVNNICLPERWSGGDCRFKPTPNCQTREYAMIAGWGHGKYRGPIYLQIGYWRLYNERYDLSTDPEHRKMKSKMGLDRLDNQSICTGDSGSPVWQYHLGRAVIVGVIATTKLDDMWCSSMPPSGIDGDPQSKAVWVDQVIDWIKDIIKSSTKQP